MAETEKSDYIIRQDDANHFTISKWEGGKQPESYYKMSLSGKRVLCECASFTNRGHCKHQEILKEWIDQGKPMGKILVAGLEVIVQAGGGSTQRGFQSRIIENKIAEFCGDMKYQPSFEFIIGQKEPVKVRQGKVGDQVTYELLISAEGSDDIVYNKTLLDAPLKAACEQIRQHGDKMATAAISKPEDIEKLPWKGNYHSDEKLFQEVDKYLVSEKDKSKQKKALELMTKHGMGDDSPVSDKDLVDYMKEMKEFATAAGEMSENDIAPGGDWFETRQELEELCQEAGLKCQVRPFDQYQGPFAKMKYGKVWLGDSEDHFFLDFEVNWMNLSGSYLKEDAVQMLKDIEGGPPEKDAEIESAVHLDSDIDDLVSAFDMEIKSYPDGSISVDFWSDDSAGVSGGPAVYVEPGGKVQWAYNKRDVLEDVAHGGDNPDTTKREFVQVVNEISEAMK